MRVHGVDRGVGLARAGAFRDLSASLKNKPTVRK
jgi:hypothetical protein